MLNLDENSNILRENLILAVVPIERSRSAQRPLESVDLLRMAADYIEAEYDAHKHELRQQPFIIDRISVDVYSGNVYIYFYRQTAKDFEYP